MIVTLTSALIGAVAALLVAILTTTNNSRRDREADWRKLKLEIYREYVTAISGIVEGRADNHAQDRYLDASHSLMLIALPEVLKVLFQFQKDHLDKRHLTPLMKAIRNDIKPRPDNSDEGIEFQMFKFIL
ncbi:hypothetical protein [Acidocella sp.]|uniref:hypothetical protein n=1 Tax=Acidocella sp. TaxID=50710 RepID=UPI003CFDBE47